jgi:hypothetical protein
MSYNDDMTTDERYVKPISDLSDDERRQVEQEFGESDWPHSLRWGSGAGSKSFLGLKKLRQTTV